MATQTIPAPLNSADLSQRHHLTREVANFCRQQLRTYLDALAPLFRPRCVLGDCVEGAGRESVPDAEQNFAALRESFIRVCGRPFDLRRELARPIDSTPTQMQLYEWEYRHGAVTITSPLTWVLTYPSVYSLPLMRQVAAGKQQRDPEAVRSFVLRACMLNLLFEKQPQLATLLEGLRYKVELRKLPDLGDLPLITVSAPVSTFRPPDDILSIATGLSGRAVFQEVLDMESAAKIDDPLQSRLSALLEAS
jgi:hypothetical protein